MRLVLLPISTAVCLTFAVCASMGQPVGVTAAVDQSATGKTANTRVRTITLGSKIIHNERIVTDANGVLQILLADGTSFTVGPNSRLTIDSFVYDPDRGTAKVAASLGKGLFRFIGAKTSKTPGGVHLKTPVGTVGIRGAIVNMVFGGRWGQPSHIDLLFGRAVQLKGNGHQSVNLYTTGYSIVIGPGGKPHIQRTPKSWLGSLQAAIGGHLGRHGGSHARPTDVMITSIAGSNSDLTPSANAFPVPLPRRSDPTGNVRQQANHDRSNTLSSNNYTIVP